MCFCFFFSFAIWRGFVKFAACFQSFINFVCQNLFITAMTHNVCLLWILAIVGADFAIEPQYDTLNHFGPTNNSNWAARPMTRVAPFTVSIGPLNVLANQEFMFVSLIPDGELIPPLGKMKWKNSKIGNSSDLYACRGFN